MTSPADSPRIPVVLDVDLLTEIARGDTDLIQVVQRYDSGGSPMVAPALALTAAHAASRPAGLELLMGLARLPQVMVAPLQGLDQAAALADVMASTGLDPWPAHVAAVAHAGVLPILTLDSSAWAHPSAALPEPLFTIEITEPDDYPDEE